MNFDSQGLTYVRELDDLYSAEHVLLKALPKMARTAACEDLRVDFEKHLNQTRVDIRRLEIAFFLAAGKTPSNHGVRP